MFKYLSTGLVLVATGSLSVAASANTARVRYSDLDLSQPRSESVLDHRLIRAAYKVCEPATPSDVIAAMACRRASLARARADANSVFASRSVTQLAKR